jgi:hypothetical protein
MITKIILSVLLIFMIVFTSILIYENVPHSPVPLSVNAYDSGNGEIDFGGVPVFGNYMRFGHNNISYYIGNVCSDTRIKFMRDAFGIVERNVNQISFYQVYSSDADIVVRCSGEFIEVGKNLYAAGEGGPTKIIKVGKFNIIESGSIYLYRDPVCNYPVVELHELLHVLGFDHSNDPKNIMYSVSNCDQRISSDIITTLRELYTIPSLPDLVITNLSVVKKGRYVDFNITIANEGLIDAKDVQLLILSEGRRIYHYDLEEINRGYARTLFSTNVKLHSSGAGSIDFFVDYDNKIKELDKNNNHINVKVP